VHLVAVGDMAEALTGRGMWMTKVEMLSEVLPTVDPSLGRLIRDRLTTAGADVVTETAARRIDELADLDLSYTAPLGSTWDAVQVAAHEWEHIARERPTSHLGSATATAEATTP
jgi:pyruvate/2-oxoglutarate dehydrogenase complex dihydrolipoamide dehydrogenase (E3) component